ncbi:hypothetical protein [Persicitalea jodogahamensis]|uniref:hypothetical protein n=1 Tax=Persicitalea jodogahamensis TaxID=402147 RepID=UPI001672F544|nr:hypothetical protein [Persicitalea jodogahamensis]
MTEPGKSAKLPVLVFRKELARRTVAYFAKGTEGADNTRKAYQSDIAQLTTWQRPVAQPELPIEPATLATHKWSTISRHPVAYHELAIKDSP